MSGSHLFFGYTNIFKRYGCYLLFSFTGLCLLSMYGNAQVAVKEASLNISGEVKKQLTLTPAMIDTMKKASIVVKDKGNKEHTYTGVNLSVLLNRAGVTLGEDLKGRNLTKYILTGASDGYQVVFSLAETDPSFTTRKIILANRKDSVLLPVNEGPFHLIVEGELRQTRFIRQVISIKVKHAE